MDVQTPIYLDNNSTTPVDPRVLEAMLPYFAQKFGNAASRTHAFGQEAESAVERAREQVATILGVTAKEIIWTSGATEANNLAIRGAAEVLRAQGDHIVTSQVEHKSVLDTCHYLETRGFRVTYLPVQSDGRVDVRQVEEALTTSTILVSVMLANNEIGTIEPVAEIGALVKGRGALFHIDAVQGLGKIPFDVQEVKADLVSLSAHKVYGPKGVGALYVRGKPRVRIAPLLLGGGHERGVRSGTLPVPLIVGFGSACDIAAQEMLEESARMLSLRECLRDKLWSELEGLSVNGSLEYRLPGNLNVSFAGVEAEALMMAAKELAVSSGSACTSASLEPSYVLRACGVPADLAYSSIRFGIGRFTTLDDIQRAATVITKHVRRLRAIRHAALGGATGGGRSYSDYSRANKSDVS